MQVSTEQMINLLVTITLIEMMVAMGLGVRATDLIAVVRTWRLVARAALANYVLIPAVTVGLLFLFPADPMVAAGFLILAACPGAPYGPPLAAVAKGDVPVAVGLMVLLAGSSAVVAPVALTALLPWVAADRVIDVNPWGIVTMLLVTQLVPLCAGVAVRQFRPRLADRVQGPAKRISKILNLVTVGVILLVQFPLLVEIRPRGFAAMLLLLGASWAAGWLMGGREAAIRRSVMITASVRNIGVALMIATSAFGGTPAVTAIAAYALVCLLGTLVLAIVVGRFPRRECSTLPAFHREEGAV